MRNPSKTPLLSLASLLLTVQLRKLYGVRDSSVKRSRGNLGARTNGVSQEEGNASLRRNWKIDLRSNDAQSDAKYSESAVGDSQLANAVRELACMRKWVARHTALKSNVSKFEGELNDFRRQYGILSRYSLSPRGESDDAPFGTLKITMRQLLDIGESYHLKLKEMVDDDDLANMQEECRNVQSLSTGMDAEAQAVLEDIQPLIARIDWITRKAQLLTGDAVQTQEQATFPSQSLAQHEMEFGGTSSGGSTRRHSLLHSGIDHYLPVSNQAKDVAIRSVPNTREYQPDEGRGDRIQSNLNSLAQLNSLVSEETLNNVLQSEGLKQLDESPEILLASHSPLRNPSHTPKAQPLPTKDQEVSKTSKNRLDDEQRIFKEIDESLLAEESMPTAQAPTASPVVHAAPMMDGTEFDSKPRDPHAEKFVPETEYMAELGKILHRLDVLESIRRQGDDMRQFEFVPPGPPGNLATWPNRPILFATPGPPGPPGPPGLQGRRGPPGRAGHDGAQGVVGNPGNPGMPGMPGMPGTAGAPGAPGVFGAPGSMGAPGSPGGLGNPGTIGPPGLPGTAGIIGSVGPQGQPGPPGYPGLLGGQGAVGSAGSPGSPGMPGATPLASAAGSTQQSTVLDSNSVLQHSNARRGRSEYLASHAENGEPQLPRYVVSATPIGSLSRPQQLERQRQIRDTIPEIWGQPVEDSVTWRNGGKSEATSSIQLASSSQGTFSHEERPLSFIEISQDDVGGTASELVGNTDVTSIEAAIDADPQSPTEAEGNGEDVQDDETVAQAAEESPRLVTLVGDVAKQAETDVGQINNDVGSAENEDESHAQSAVEAFAAHAGEIDDDDDDETSVARSTSASTNRAPAVDSSRVGGDTLLNVSTKQEKEDVDQVTELDRANSKHTDSRKDTSNSVGRTNTDQSFAAVPAASSSEASPAASPSATPGAGDVHISGHENFKGGGRNSKLSPSGSPSSSRPRHMERLKPRSLPTFATLDFHKNGHITYNDLIEGVSSCTLDASLAVPLAAYDFSGGSNGFIDPTDYSKALHVQSEFADLAGSSHDDLIGEAEYASMQEKIPDLADFRELNGKIEGRIDLPALLLSRAAAAEFVRLDSDRDHLLSKSDLRVKFGHDASAEMKYDEDQDGKLDKHDFLHLMVDWLQFKLLGAGQDGVTLKDFLRATEDLTKDSALLKDSAKLAEVFPKVCQFHLRCNGRVTSNDLSNYFSTADSNKDGRLSFSEFVVGGKEMEARVGISPALLGLDTGYISVTSVLDQKSSMVGGFETADGNPVLYGKAQGGAQTSLSFTQENGSSLFEATVFVDGLEMWEVSVPQEVGSLSPGAYMIHLVSRAGFHLSPQSSYVLKIHETQTADSSKRILPELASIDMNKDGNVELGDLIEAVIQGRLDARLLVPLSAYSLLGDVQSNTKDLDYIQAQRDESNFSELAGRGRTARLTQSKYSEVQKKIATMPDFESVDIHNRGWIRLGPFLLSRVMAAKFAELDTTKTGSIIKAELRAHFSKSTDDIFAFDIDKDDALNKNELLRAMVVFLQFQLLKSANSDTIQIDKLIPFLFKFGQGEDELGPDEVAKIREAFPVICSNFFGKLTRAELKKRLEHSTGSNGQITLAELTSPKTIDQQAGDVALLKEAPGAFADDQLLYPTLDGLRTTHGASRALGCAAKDRKGFLKKTFETADTSPAFVGTSQIGSKVLILIKDANEKEVHEKAYSVTPRHSWQTETVPLSIGSYTMRLGAEVDNTPSGIWSLYEIIITSSPIPSEMESPHLVGIISQNATGASANNIPKHLHATDSAVAFHGTAEPGATATIALVDAQDREVYQESMDVDTDGVWKSGTAFLKTGGQHRVTIFAEKGTSTSAMTEADLVMPSSLATSPNVSAEETSGMITFDLAHIVWNMPGKGLVQNDKKEGIMFKRAKGELLWSSNASRNHVHKLILHVPLGDYELILGPGISGELTTYASAAVGKTIDIKVKKDETKLAPMVLEVGPSGQSNTERTNLSSGTWDFHMGSALPTLERLITDDAHKDSDKPSMHAEHATSFSTDFADPGFKGTGVPGESFTLDVNGDEGTVYEQEVKISPNGTWNTEHMDMKLNPGKYHVNFMFTGANVVDNDHQYTLKVHAPVNPVRVYGWETLKWNEDMPHLIQEPILLDSGTKFELGAGWISYTVVLFLSLVCFVPLVSSRKAGKDITFMKSVEFRSWLAEIVWGDDNKYSVLFDILWISVSAANLFLFGVCTEISYQIAVSITEPYPGLFMKHLTLSMFIFRVHDIIELMSVIFLVIVIILRLLVVHKHPYFQRFGAGAWWNYLLFSPYSLIDTFALVSTSIDRIVFPFLYPQRSLRINFLGLFLARIVEVLKKHELGVGLADVPAVLKRNWSLIFTQCSMAGIMWILFSSWYYWANKDNNNSRWSSATYKDDDAGEADSWQRFDSVPSSMFFVLINLLKEHPLPYVFNTWYQRIPVIFCNFIGAQLMALPTSLFASLILQRAEEELNEEHDVEESDEEIVEDVLDIDSDDEIEDSGEVQPEEGAAQAGAKEPEDEESEEESEEEEETEEEDGEADPELNDAEVVVPQNQGLSEARKQSLKLGITSCLSFSSIIAYFYYTAQACKGCNPPMLLFQPVRISYRTLAIVDGAVGLIFGVEIVLRFIAAHWKQTKWKYVSSVFGVIDIICAIFGQVHLLIFCASLCGNTTATVFMKVSPQGEWLRALCVLRILKLERYIRTCRLIAEVFVENRRLLVGTLSFSGLMWLFFTLAMYMSQNLNPDPEVRSQFGSLPRAAWAQVLNLHGEFIWCDFTAFGKAVTVLMAVGLVGIWCVPLTCISQGFLLKIIWAERKEVEEGESDEEVSDEQSDEDKPVETQLSMRVSKPGIRQAAFDLYYCHLQEDIMRENNGLRPFRHKVAFGISLVFTIGTIVVTVACQAMPETPNDDVMELIDDAFYTIDVIAVPCFLFEWGTRTLGLGHKYLLSWSGMCDILSIIGVAASCYDRRLLHPVIQRDEATAWDHNLILSLKDDAVLQLRLLRIYCLEDYFCVHGIVWGIFKTHRKKLFKALYGMMVTWFLVTTVVYLSEKDRSHKRSMQADRYSNAQLTMAQRYQDMLSALPYTLIHLTGDFPIYEYSFKSSVALTFGWIIGMCCYGTFIAVFSMYYVSNIAQERMLELEQLHQRRAMSALRVAIRLQRAFRERKKRRQSEGKSDSPPKAKGLRIWCRKTVEMLTPIGRRLMWLFMIVLCIDVALSLLRTTSFVANTTNNKWHDKNYLLWINITQIIFNIVFIVEYIIRILARDWKMMFSPPRLLDLLCLAPAVFRFSWGIADPPIDQGKAACSFLNGWLQIPIPTPETYSLMCTFRVLRIFYFPYFRRGFILITRSFVDSISYLVRPAFKAFAFWLTLSSLYMWSEQYFGGPARNNMRTIFDSMYWTSMFVIGEWPMADFDQGTSTRLIVITIMYGVMIFSIPFGILVEAADSAIRMAIEEKKELARMHAKEQEALLRMAKRRNKARSAGSTGSKEKPGGDAAGESAVDKKPLQTPASSVTAGGPPVADAKFAKVFRSLRFVTGLKGTPKSQSAAPGEKRRSVAKKSKNKGDDKDA